MNDNPHLNDRELGRLAAEVDRLAMQDRGDAGLETRIFAASLPVLQGARARTGTPAMRLVGDVPAVVVRPGASRLAVRIAAGFAVAATAGIAWLGTHRPGGPVTHSPILATATPAVSTADDEWAIASSILDDDLADQLSTLSTKASVLRDDLDSIGTGDSYEEAM
jgi:hypothetical protein